MHHRERFDAGPLPLGVLDYSSRLRGVFQKAVGYALASSLLAAGCGSSREPRPEGEATAKAPVSPPERSPAGSSAAETAALPPTSEAMPPAAPEPPLTAGSAAPTVNSTTAGAAAPMPQTPRETPVKIQCQNGVAQLFSGIQAQPFDSAGFLIQSASTEGPALLFAKEWFCTTATDVDACLAKVAAAEDKASLPLSDDCGMWGMCTRYVITTRADEVRKYQSRKELLQFLGPIDSPEDALLVLYYDNLNVLCPGWSGMSSFIGLDPTSIRERSDGYEVLYRILANTCGGSMQSVVTYHVATDGTVTEIKRENMSTMTGCPGRRPEGLSSRHLGTNAPALGEYLAGMAHLEHASIAAFEVLAAELAHHGAPADLIAAARSAADDEVRHTATTSLLARRFGATPKQAEVASRPLRTLEAIALDNATEGCVRECFGAAVGCYQAQSAADPEIAAAMTEISEDETRHAALAFAIDAWLQPLLDARGRARVVAARGEAVDVLRGELTCTPDAVTREALGLPDTAAALRICATLEASIWA